MTDKPLEIAYEAKRITHNATGLGNYGRTIVEMLARQAPQHRYLLYTPDPGREELRKRLPECRQIEIRLPRTPKHGLMKAWWRSAGICRELPAGVSLFHGLGAELPRGLRKRGIPSVVTIHDLIFLRFPAYYKWFDRKIYAWKYRAACRQADRIVAISEATKRDIVSFFGIAPEKIDVVYQGCDESFKREVTDETKRAVREKYALPERYVLSVGSIEERKNLLLLVQAAARMAEPIHIVAVGKRTPYTAEVERFAAEHGLAGRLHLYHDVRFAELPVFYRMAEVFVYPSRFEGFGIPMIEAACCGVPAVGAVGSCLEEAGGPDAVYVDPDDPQELADRLTEILADEALRRRMSERGRAYVGRFEPEKLAADMLAVYDKTIQQQKNER